jgi:hypothetical protein
MRTLFSNDSPIFRITKENLQADSKLRKEILNSSSKELLDNNLKVEFIKKNISRLDIE